MPFIASLFVFAITQYYYKSPNVDRTSRNVFYSGPQFGDIKLLNALDLHHTPVTFKLRRARQVQVKKAY